MFVLLELGESQAVPLGSYTTWTSSLSSLSQQTTEEKQGVALRSEVVEFHNKENDP